MLQRLRAGSVLSAARVTRQSSSFESSEFEDPKGMETRPLTKAVVGRGRIARRRS